MEENGQHDPLQRPFGACVLCPPPKGHAWVRADDRHVTCGPCYDRLRERLSEVAERYLLLDPRPGANPGWGGRGSPGFVSRPPVSVHIVSMRDPRSSADAKVWLGSDGRVHAEETRPPLSTYGVLSTLSWTIAEHRGVSGPGDRDDVYALIKFIDVHVDYVTRSRELAVEVDQVLRGLLAGMRPVTGAGRRKIGPCPMMVERVPDDDISTEPVKVRCDTLLFTSRKLDEDAVTCSGCGHSWQMSQWLTIGDESGAESSVEPAR